MARKEKQPRFVVHQEYIWKFSLQFESQLKTMEKTKQSGEPLSVTREPTNVGWIALERQARQFNSSGLLYRSIFLYGCKKPSPHRDSNHWQSLLRSTRDHSKMMNKSVKKSLDKAKNVLKEKRKIVKRKICIKKTHTFTIIAMNCVQEQLIINPDGRATNFNQI